MDHCIDCGLKVSRGRVNYHSQHAKRCLLCQVTRAMATFRYLSPAAKRYRAAAERDAREAEAAALRAQVELTNKTAE